MKEYSSIQPIMFRALTCRSKEEKEFNNKIIESGIVPATQKVRGSGEDGEWNPPIFGSLWTLNLEIILHGEYAEWDDLHSILQKRISIGCLDGKLVVNYPFESCKIYNNVAEGVMILCDRPVKFDSVLYNRYTKYIGGGMQEWIVRMNKSSGKDNR